MFESTFKERMKVLPLDEVFDVSCLKYCSIFTVENTLMIHLIELENFISLEKCLKA